MADSSHPIDSILKEVLKKKPPISASTTAEITKIASKQRIEDVFEVVSAIEKFILTSPAQYRLSGLYLIDSICKSKSPNRNAYLDHFSKKLLYYIAAALHESTDKEKESVKKLARIWIEKRVFTDDVCYGIAHIIEKLLNYIVPGSESLKPPSGFAVQQTSSDFSQSGQWGYPGSAMMPQVQHNINNPGYLAPATYPPVQMNQIPAANSMPSNSTSLGSSLTNPSAIDISKDLELIGDVSSLLDLELPSSNFEPEKNDFSSVSSKAPHNDQYNNNNNQYPHQHLQHYPSQRGPANVNNQFRQENQFRDQRDNNNRDYQRDNNNNNRDYQRDNNQFHNNNFRDRNFDFSRNSNNNSNNNTSSFDPNVRVFSSTLFLGSLPPSIAEHDLRELFSKFGKINKITLKPERGIAFIAFDKRADAEMARATNNGMNLGNRALRIGWAKSDFGFVGTVDPETGEMIPEGASRSTNFNSNQSSSNSQNTAPAYGIPRGLKPIPRGDVFASPESPNNNNNNNYRGNDDYDDRHDYDDDHYNDDGDNPRKRKYEGDHPSVEKRSKQPSNTSYDSQFQAMSSYSGSY